ncbi:hypothetical protein [Oricola indica]|jgi:hypothetical protein|uniref:hypothetical protein n=1 Tax=Oricola indica TaxID=2872591 RepID=UPI001CBD4A9D|nr:hypothetical protein [Oricola indica]
MEFNWRGAVDRNCEILCTIAGRLIVMAGIQAGRTADTLPRFLYLRILALLRPAEFAARRLIAMAACKLVMITVRPVTERRRPPRNSVILGLEPRTHSGDAATASKTENEEPSSVIAGVLRLGGVNPRVNHEDGVRNKTPRKAADTPQPAFVLFDPFKPFAEPWLTEAEIAALDNPSDGVFVPASRPNEPVDARALGRRIRALANALDDLDGQALRLARWRARRAAGSGRPIRFSPFRPGFPPGWRKRPKTEIEEVLKECNYLGLEAWNTS